MISRSIGLWGPSCLLLLSPLAIVVGAIGLLAGSSAQTWRLSVLLVEDGHGAIYRSAFAGLISVILIGGAAFWSAFALSKSSLEAYAGRDRLLFAVAPLAATPMLIGVGAYAFLYRDLGSFWLMLFGPEGHGPAAVLVIVAAAQLTRYAPLLFWLLILSAADVRRDRRLYGSQIAASGSQWGRVELTQRWMPTLLVVLAFAFQDASNDVLISYLALRPAEATNSELVGHSLTRGYWRLLTSQPASEAMAAVLWVSIATALLFAAAFIGLAALIVVLLRRFSKLPAKTLERSNVSSRHARITAGSTLSSVTLLVFLLMLLRLRPSSAVEQVASLFSASAVAAATAVFCWVLALPALYRLRDRPQHLEHRLNRHFAWASAAAVGLGFLPSIGLGFSVLSVAYWIGADFAAMGFFWLFLAETLRFAPVVFVLLVPTVLGVPSENIEYLRATGVSFFRRLSLTLLRPYWHIHAAILLISFNLVLNEPIVAAVFQVDVPSLADLMRKATSGRAADYGVAGGLIVAEVLLFGSLLFIWGWHARARWGSDRDAH